MILYPEIEQNYFAKTAKGIKKIRRDSTILLEWLAY